MLMGEFNHTIDIKNRVFIPAKLRDDLGEHFVITVGLDGCLYIYPDEEWKIFVEKFKNYPGSREARTLLRTFTSNANECEVDKQGRIIIPSKLKETAAIDKDVVFAGALNKVELWSRERWNVVSKIDDMDEMAEKMAALGLSF